MFCLERGFRETRRGSGGDSDQPARGPDCQDQARHQRPGGESLSDHQYRPTVRTLSHLEVKTWEKEGTLIIVYFLSNKSLVFYDMKYDWDNNNTYY